MVTDSNELIFYGIDNMSQELDSIIQSLDIKNNNFEIKLIMCEAITNAFIHGNNKDKSKPIIVMCNKEKDYLSISVKDCGMNKQKLDLDKDIDEDIILEESGRGLFIISSYSDEVKFENGCIIMKKLIK